jgi:hypothetical protein
LIVDPARLGGAPCHQQCPDRFDVAVAVFGLAELAVGLGRPACFDGVEGVGLALAAPFLAVRAAHLDHLHAGPAQEP